ncbi:MAG: hypothetical protein WC526_02265 [Patescibacteria group bacterium]
MIFDNEEIIAFVIHGLMYCLDCAEKHNGEREPVTEDSIREGQTAVCDGCHTIIIET